MPDFSRFENKSIHSRIDMSPKWSYNHRKNTFSLFLVFISTYAIQYTTKYKHKCEKYHSIKDIFSEITNSCFKSEKQWIKSYNFEEKNPTRWLWIKT